MSGSDPLRTFGPSPKKVALRGTAVVPDVGSQASHRPLRTLVVGGSSDRYRPEGDVQEFGMRTFSVGLTGAVLLFHATSSDRREQG